MVAPLSHTCRVPLERLATLRDAPDYFEQDTYTFKAANRRIRNLKDVWQGQASLSY